MDDGLFLYNACQYITCAWLLANMQTTSAPELFSTKSDVSALLKDDILLSSANTGHYCSVTLAPPCINPMSDFMSAAGHTNSLEPYLEPTLATATQHTNNLSTESVSWVCQFIYLRLFHCELIFFFHRPSASNLVHFRLCSQLLMSYSYPHLCSHTFSLSCGPKLQSCSDSVRSTSWCQTAAKTWCKKKKNEEEKKSVITGELIHCLKSDLHPLQDAAVRKQQTDMSVNLFIAYFALSTKRKVSCVILSRKSCWVFSSHDI